MGITALTPSYISVLAALPDRSSYINPYKILVVVVLLFAWAYIVQWIDRDTDVVKTKREHWNTIVAAGSFVAFFALFIPPWSGILFLAGVGFWLAVFGGAAAFYVAHRNGRVAAPARVLTAAHLKRVLGGAGKSKGKLDKGMRVRIVDHSGDAVDKPDDPDEYMEYDAAQEFLYSVLWRRSSEVDVIAGKEKFRVVYRIDGVASEDPDGLDPTEGERVLRYLKKVAGLNVDEIRKPQRGSIEAALLSQDGDAGRTTVHTSGTTAGERLRLHVESGAELFRIHLLGFSPPRLDIVKQIISKPTGLFLQSAPARQGLTTTQYAMVRVHDAYIQNIHTLERRPLLDLDNVTQQVFDGSNDEVHYARMLQTVLRREPNVVLVSDCENQETAQIASRAASDDRKIYLSIHAKDSFDALSKYLRLLNDNALAAKALLGVMCQRLVRILCKDCREAYKPDPATLKKLNLPGDKIETFYRPPSEPATDKRGRPIVCPSCQGSGYVGRTGVYEVLIVDSSVAKLIEEGTPINRIKAQCRKNKMYYLQEEALLKVIDGTTSMKEVLRSLRDDGQ